MDDLDGMDTFISCQKKPIRHFDGSASDLLAKDGVWGRAPGTGVQGTGVSCLGLGQSPGNI